MLTKRLAACAALVTRGGVVCDVGTDHAYLPAYLLEQNICPRAIAADIHKGPLEAARRTLTAAGLLSQVDLVCCDGLTGISPANITDVVIAGMGGETIVHILEECPWKTQVHLILQPMTKLPVLRRWLAENGFFWTEQIVPEGKQFYVIMDVRYTGICRSPSPLEEAVGCLDWKEDSARQYGSWKKTRFQRLAEQLEQGGQPDAEKWKALAAQLEAMLEE